MAVHSSGTCVADRDLGHGYSVRCTVPGTTHTVHVWSGDGERISWGRGMPQCPATAKCGHRCYADLHAGNTHWTLDPKAARSRRRITFKTPANVPVTSVNTKASQTLLGPCMHTRELSPGYQIQCVLSADHGYPHLVRSGSLVHTWGYETQCRALHHSHLRCLNGNGHEGAHMTLYGPDHQATYWVGGMVSEETRRAILEQQTLLDPGYIEVLKQRGLEQSAHRPRTYAERKRGRR